MQFSRCELCNKYYDSDNSLNIHYKYCHNNEIKYNSTVKLLGRYRINAVIEDISTFMEQKRGNVKSTLDINNDLKINFSALHIPEENIYQLYNPFITGNLKYLE
jgi:hypothetical protein